MTVLPILHGVATDGCGGDVDDSDGRGDINDSSNGASVPKSALHLTHHTAYVDMLQTLITGVLKC